MLNSNAGHAKGLAPKYVTHALNKNDMMAEYSAGISSKGSSSSTYGTTASGRFTCAMLLGLRFQLCINEGARDLQGKFFFIQ
jgi:hypothetical protein